MFCLVTFSFGLLSTLTQLSFESLQTLLSRKIFFTLLLPLTLPSPLDGRGLE